MKKQFVKVLSLVMALMMVVGTFSTMTFAADEHVHTKGEKGATVAATCSAFGYTWYTCAGCGEQYMDDVTSKLAHKWTDVAAKDSTCTAVGNKAYKKCSACGEKSGYVEIAKKAHKYDVYVGKVEATCTTAEGLKYKCTMCSATQIRDFSGAVAAKGHDYQYTTVTAPGVCKDGEAKGACSRCNATVKVVVKAAHKYAAVNVTEPTTCKTLLNGYQCTLCGNVAVKNDVITVAGASVTVTADATYNNNVKHNFSTAGVAMNATIEAMGYNSIAKEATCTATGYQIEKCTICSAYNVKVLEAKQHNLEWSALQGGVTPATPVAAYCVSAYTKTATCKNNCGYTETKTIKAATPHVLADTVKAPTCTDQGYTTHACVNCGYSYKDTYVNAKGHSYGATTRYAYDANKDGVQDATGRVKTYDCTTGVMDIKACTNKNDNVTCGVEHVTIIAMPSGGHKLTEANGTDRKFVAATCSTKGYYAPYCLNEFCSFVDATQKTEVGTVDTTKTNHVARTAAMGGTAAPDSTCTATGTFVYVCTCGTEIHEIIAKKSHDKVKGLYTDASKKEGFTATTTNVAATCNSIGWKVGEYCRTCQTWLTAPTQVAKDATKHANSTYTLLSVVKYADCINNRIERGVYTCCNKVENITIKKSAGTCRMVTVEGKKPTCTTAGNHEYTYCPGCETVYTVQFYFGKDANRVACDETCKVNHTEAATLVNYTIPALEHTLEEVDKKPESCTVSGYTKHKRCTACATRDANGVITAYNYTEGYEFIPAHGNAHLITLSPASGSRTYPTCTTEGFTILSANSNKKYCSVCDKGVKYTIQPAYGHFNTSKVFAEVNKVGSDKYDCTLPSYTVIKCTGTDNKNTANKCTEYRVVDYTESKYGAHNFELVWHKYTVKDNLVYLDGELQANLLACEFKTYEYRACTVAGCKATEKRNEQAPIAHVALNGSTKVEISLDCDKIANFASMVCIICNKTVVNDNKATDVLKPAHKLVTTTKEDTCDEIGYTITACTVCGYVASNVEHNTLKNHTLDPNKIIETVQPTTSKDGYQKGVCIVCKKEVTIVIEADDVTFSFEATNNLVNGANVVNSGIVSLIVKTSAAKVDVNSIKLAIGYDVTKLTFVDAQVLNAAFANRAFAGAETITLANGAKQETGIVNVAVAAPNSTAGKIQNITLDGDNVALVKLNFKVLENVVAEGQAFAEADKPYYETNFWCESAEVLSKDGTVSTDDAGYISINVVGKEANRPAGVVLTADKDFSYGALALVGTDADIENLADGKVWAVAAVKIYALGDVNMDGIINGSKNASLDDAIALVKIWTNESELGKYSGAADIDKDGAITVADYELLMMYITNEISYNAFLNKGVEPAVKPEGPNVVVNPDGSVTIKPVA